MLENQPFDRVEDEMLSRVNPLEGEMMPLRWCYFRYLSEDLRSQGSLPPFSIVAYDGYAVISKDIERANPYQPVSLELIESVACGQQQSKRITSGKCVFVESGSHLPRGADSVVEASRVEEKLERAFFKDAVKSGAGFTEEESVIRPNDLVMRKGDYLTPARVGILSSLGHVSVTVVRPPVIGLISTGNELVPSDIDKMKPGQIRDANSHMLSAKLAELRLPQMSLGVVPDSRNALVSEISRVIRQVDGLIITGGKVKGRKKFLEETVGSSGELVINGVYMNPGGSFSFGLLDSKPIFALPGSPADALLTFDILVKSVIQKMMGARDYMQPVRNGVLEGTIELDCERDSFLWARFEIGDDRTFRIIPLSDSLNVNLADTIRASCIIKLSAGRHSMKHGDPISFIATSPDRLLTPPMFIPEHINVTHITNEPKESD
jgi:molybdopterin molybdotransferase